MWRTQHFTVRGKSIVEAQERIQAATDAFFAAQREKNESPKDVKLEASVCYCLGEPEPFVLYCALAYKCKAHEPTSPT